METDKSSKLCSFRRALFSSEPIYWENNKSMSLRTRILCFMERGDDKKNEDGFYEGYLEKRKKEKGLTQLKKSS